MTPERSALRALGVARGKTNVKLGIYSNAPVGSAAAGASAILHCTLACIFSAATTAGICLWAGVTPAVTVTMAMVIFGSIALPMLYLTFRTTTPTPVTVRNHGGNTPSTPPPPASSRVAVANVRGQYA